jgi:uncharacterized protein with von Willebrand factor type A (vWA) domain
MPVGGQSEQSAGILAAAPTEATGMFLQFFTSLRDAQVPVTLREYLTLMEALDADLADQSVEHFYYLSRASLVKDERNLDKFDRVFGSVFKGLESLLDAMEKAETSSWRR